MYESEFFITFIYHRMRWCMLPQASESRTGILQNCARTGTGLNRLEPVQHFFLKCARICIFTLFRWPKSANCNCNCDEDKFCFVNQNCTLSLLQLICCTWTDELSWWVDLTFNNQLNIFWSRWSLVSFLIVFMIDARMTVFTKAVLFFY